MLKSIEKILIKLRGNTLGYDFNMFDWDILSLGEHYWKGEPLTKSEQYAEAFLEEVRKVLDVWQPPEKWVKPTGEILNEHRNLH